ncbi:hypothetical protein TNCV_3873821 [Trichonephila clavipes]|nr:hypothetical protein TNCV_3873821 [Trichonephila clavipes]
MGKLSDLDAFDRRQIVGALYVVNEAKRKLKLPPSSMTVPVVQSMNELCNTRFTVWVLRAFDLREYHSSKVAIRLHVLPVQESTKTGV